MTSFCCLTIHPKCLPTWKKKKIVWVFLSQHRITLLLPLSLSFSCLLTIHSYQQWPEERVQSVKPAAKSLQLCPTLCNPMQDSPPGFSVHGDSPARILEWVAMPCSRGSSLPRDWTQVSCIADRFFCRHPQIFSLQVFPHLNQLIFMCKFSESHEGLLFQSLVLIQLFKITISLFYTVHINTYLSSLKDDSYICTGYFFPF